MTEMSLLKTSVIWFLRTKDHVSLPLSAKNGLTFVNIKLFSKFLFIQLFLLLSLNIELEQMIVHVTIVTVTPLIETSLVPTFTN